MFNVYVSNISSFSLKSTLHTRGNHLSACLREAVACPLLRLDSRPALAQPRTALRRHRSRRCRSPSTTCPLASTDFRVRHSQALSTRRLVLLCRICVVFVDMMLGVFGRETAIGGAFFRNTRYPCQHRSFTLRPPSGRNPPPSNRRFELAVEICHP